MINYINEFSKYRGTCTIRVRAIYFWDDMNIKNNNNELLR
jgi:hypothetical protein